MSVHQTRKHFLGKYNVIVDNPQVGKDLTEHYWKPGNGEQFMELVHRLTGSPLAGDAWVEALQTSTDALLATERQEYASAVKSGPVYAPCTSVDLDMRVKLVHGDVVVADSETSGGLYPACEQYKEWLLTL